MVGKNTERERRRFPRVGKPTKGAPCFFPIIGKAITILLFTCSFSAHAALFDFRNDAAVYGPLDNQAGPVTVTVDGIEATFTASSGVMNQTTSGFGLNSTISGDDTDAMDNGEWIDITFGAAVVLSNVTVSSWSTANGDEATIYVNGVSNGVIASTGEHAFNINVPLGQQLRIAGTAGSIGNGWSLDSITVDAVTVPANSPPVLDPIGGQSVNEGQVLMFMISASDANSDPLTYTASNLPPGATFSTNTITPQFTWAPAGPAGVYTSRFTVADGFTNDFEDVVITVNPLPPNNPPVIAPIGSQAVTVSNSLSFAVVAGDVDNDTVTLSASNLPPGAVFSTVSAAGVVSNTFNWAVAAPTGTWHTTFYADDGTTNVFEEITITVTNLPAPPALTGAVWNVVYNLPYQSGSGSDYPGQFKIRNALVNRINALESGDSAILATFTFSAEDGAGTIMNAVSSALDRGAAVSFIADGDINLGTVYGGTNSLLSLSTRPVNPLTLAVDGSTSGILHDKLGLFDYGGSSQWVFIASWNFTLGASANQWNIALEARSPSLYSIYMAEAAELLDGRFHDDPAKSHAHDGSTFLLDGSWGTNFARFSPPPDSRTVEDDIIDQIDSAQNNIVFALNKLNREPIRDALIAAAGRGVIIQGVMPRSDTDPGGVSEDVYNALTNVVEFLPAAAKADYSTLDSGEPDLVHAKYMVIDAGSSNATVIHGSANWTYSALVDSNQNDENTVFLRHNKIAAQFYNHFERITGTGAYSEGSSTLVSWNFTDQDQIADGGIAANAAQTVVRAPAPAGYSYTDNALSCSGWNDGSGTTYWETSFATTDHTDIKVSSVQKASSTGPSDFKLQYKTSFGGTYTDVPYSEVHVPDGGNGVLTRVLLPQACENQAEVYLRWILTSNYRADGITAIGASGAGRIDDILITGTAYNQPPILDPIGGRTAFEGEALTFPVTASDPVDGDPVSLSAADLPAGAVFTNNTFVWTTAAPSGIYSVTFTASDKDGADSESVTITVLQKPLLLISEIADPAGTGGGDFRFIELYNAGSNTIDLAADNWVLSRQNSGSTWYDIELTGTIAASETYILAQDSDNFENAYGFPPNQANSNADGNGDDGYFLYRAGGHAAGLLIDSYGEIDTDGTDTDWDYTDSRAVRKGSITEPNPVWTASEWIILPNAAVNAMNPGVRQSLPQFDGLKNQFAALGRPVSFPVSASDPVDGDPVSLSAANLPTGALFTNGVFSWDTAAPLGSYTVTFSAADKDGTTSEDIVITVIEAPLLMISEVADPDSTLDESGEELEDGALFRFVELYNAGLNAIDLTDGNWYLSRQINGVDSWDDIQLTGTVAAAGTWVVAYSAPDFEEGFGFAPNQESSNISGNGDDAYVLYYGGDHASGTLIDIYGQLDTDGSDTDWEYENGYAERERAVLMPNTVWTASEWIIRTGSKDSTSPGVHGPVPVFQGLEDQFVFLGDDLSLIVTAVNTVRTDTITLSATALPDGANFPTVTRTDAVSSTLSWSKPPAGVYTVTFAAAGAADTATESITITVSSTTAIDGYFYGWKSDTIVKLKNGQFWKNTGGVGSTVSRLRSPDATITNVFGSRRMIVESVPSYTTVEQIDITESGLDSTFSGLHSGNIYELADGTVWKQISYENISSSASPVTVWRWTDGAETFLRFLDRYDAVIGTCEAAASAVPTGGPVVTQIDGWFRGWKNHRVYALANGQFWQQITADSSVDTLYRPTVTLTNFLGTGTWRLYVEGASAPGYVEVQQRTDVTRTAIDGTFYGFGSGEFFHLQNGEWWRQTSLDTSASTRSGPDVLLWSESGSVTLEMPDEGRSVSAEQLNVISESSITGTYRGLRYARCYILANGQDWAQISFENIPSDQQNPAAILWTADGETRLLARDQTDRTIGDCTVISPWADDDGDGIANIDEMIAGTSLLDRNDLFMIALGSPDSEGRAVLRWVPVPGRTYTIEWTPSLLQGFQTLETLTDWTRDSWTDTINLPGRGGFYRVRAQLTN